jgi:hypothetical protein
MEPPVGQQVADQLVDEVMLRLSRLGALLPGLDHDLDRCCRQMRAAAAGIADRLAAGGPTARSTAATIYNTLWAVEAPRASWWQTPLGRAMASARPTSVAPNREMPRAVEELSNPANA